MQALGDRPDNDSFVKLEEVDIGACVRVGDAGVLALLHGCKGLVTLSMSGCTKVRGQGARGSGVGHGVWCANRGSTLCRRPDVAP
jgi:hypothetical protein